MKNKEKTNDLQIIKTNAYIISPFSQTVFEQKLIILCISKISDMLSNGEIDREKESPITFNLGIKETISFLGSNSNDIYKQLRHTCKKLTNNVIYVESDDSQDFEYVVAFPYAKLDTKKGILTIRSETRIWSYLIDFMSGYTKYMSSNIEKFTSKYSIKMYEVLKSMSYRGKWRVDIQTFKDMIGVIEPKCKETNKIKEYTRVDKMPMFGNFKQKILSPSLDDINTFSDIYVTYEPIKLQGRSYTHLDFIISNNISNIGKNETKLIRKRTRIVIPKELQPLVDIIKTFLPKSMNNKQYLELLKASDNSVDKIRDIYNYTQNRDKKKKVRGLYPYMLKGLQDGWLDSDELSITIESDMKSQNINIPNTKNKFNQFPQREYSKDDYEQIELAMMNMNYFEDK